MPCSLMVTVISLLPASICHTLLCMHICVLERESEREEEMGGKQREKGWKVGGTE